MPRTARHSAPARKRQRKPPHADLIGLPTRLADAIGKRDQKDVAKAAGVAESSISRILNNRALAGVYADTIVRLARELGVAPGWLLANDGLKYGVWVQVEPGRADAAELAARRLGGQSAVEAPTNELGAADKKR